MNTAIPNTCVYTRRLVALSSLKPSWRPVELATSHPPSYILYVCTKGLLCPRSSPMPTCWSTICKSDTRYTPKTSSIAVSLPVLILIQVSEFLKQQSTAEQKQHYHYVFIAAEAAAATTALQQQQQLSCSSNKPRSSSGISYVAVAAAALCSISSAPLQQQYIRQRQCPVRSHESTGTHRHAGLFICSDQNNDVVL